MKKREKEPPQEKKKRPPEISVYTSNEIDQRLQAYADRLGVTKSAAANMIFAKALGIRPPGEDDSQSPSSRPGTPPRADIEKTRKQA